MFTLDDKRVRVSIDDQGQLCSLLNPRTGTELARTHELLRLILTTPVCDEFEVHPQGKPSITADENHITVTFTSFVAEDGAVYPIQADATVSLRDGDAIWNLALRNSTQDATVREAHYPIIALRHSEPPATYIHAHEVSTKNFDLHGTLKHGCVSGYMAPDYKYHRTSHGYPGRYNTVNFFLLDLKGEGLYYACYDPHFNITFHAAELELRTGTDNLFMSRLPVLKPGQAWDNADICMTPYCGSTVEAAGKYRAWANSWFTVPAVPEHVRNMKGWQRIILHHQFGEYYYKYNQLVQLYEDGKKAGLDTLFLFGWTQEGMDAGYPTYSPDETQGGFQALKENIRKVRERGGHVILYFNGQLIDTASDYYRSGKGQQVSIKRADGLEHRETYNFSDTGIYLRSFGNKTFVVACPSSEDWFNILKEHVDQAFQLGVDGVFFDQLGTAPYPCCDPTHHHPVPFINLMEEKRDMLRRLYEYVKGKDPNMAFGIECVNDTTASFTDFTHIYGDVAQVVNGGWKERKELPKFVSDDCIFKSAFPEIIISDRNQKDDNNVELHVNRAFLLGRRTDVEIYRCRASIAATPHYQEYLGKVNALRDEFDIAMNGTFVGTTRHAVDNPAVQTNAFAQDNRLAVILSQNTADVQTTQVQAPGYHLLRFDSASKDVTVENGRVTMPPDALAVLLFQQD